MAKDFVIFPLLSGKAARKTLTANLTANLARNLWAYLVIFCGHFPDGAEKFTEESLVDETQGQWYLRQMLGSANFNAGPAMAFMSGNLCYQIEHHLFPDLPSNRYADISVRVRQLCEKYDLPYTTGPILVQYWQTFRTIAKLSLPDKYLTATADDAPETASEKRFAGLRAAAADRGKRIVAAGEGRREGLKTAIAEVKARRKALRAG
jgi:NADPH-dependent stearoyl-CoA 9-desaturase